MSLARRFLTGSALNLLDQALRFVAIFVMTPIIVRALGDDVYGFWILLMSIFGHYALLDFGLSFSISRFFAQAIGKGDDDELELLINTALAIFFRVAALAALLSLVAWFVTPVFTDDPDKIRIVRWIAIVYGAFISLGFPVRVFRSFLKSHLRYDLIVSASAVQIVIGNALIFYFIKQGHGILTLAIVNATAGFLEYAIVTAAALRLMKAVRFRRSLVSRERKWELIKYSSTAFVTQLANNLRHKLDPLIISSVVSFGAVTLYSVGMRFPLFFNDLVGAVLGGQLLALFAQLHGRKSGGSIENEFLAATRLSSVIALFGGASIIFYGSHFIQRWMGDGYSVSYDIMAILTIPYILALIQYPSRSLIYTLDKHRYLAITTIIAGVVNVVLSIVLAHFIGVYGVVWATFIEMIAVYGVIIPVIVSRVSGIPLGKIFATAIIRPLVIAGLILTPYLLFARGWLEADYIRLTLLGIGQVVWFSAIAWFVLVKPDERTRLISTIRPKGTGA